jgi:hypothetical protein
MRGRLDDLRVRRDDPATGNLQVLPKPERGLEPLTYRLQGATCVVARGCFRGNGSRSHQGWGPTLPRMLEGEVLR